MRKHSFDRVRKTLCTLLVVLLLVSLTATSASAWYNKKGEIVAPPEKAKVETPKETKAASVPAPVTAPVTAPPVMATAPSAFGDCYGFGCGGGCGDGWWGDCGCGCDKPEASCVTAVRACKIKGGDGWDGGWWN